MSRVRVGLLAAWVAAAPLPVLAAGGPVQHAAPQDTPTLEAHVAGQGFMRRLRFQDDVFGALSTYRLRRAGAAALSVGVYPLQPFTDGPLRNAGLLLRGTRSVGLRSVAPDGTVHATQAQRLEVGARWRLPLRTLELSLTGLYGTHAFTVEAGEAAGFTLPDVDYRFAGGELGARKVLGRRWAVTGRAGYQHLLGAGSLAGADAFPHLRGGAVEGELGVELGLTRALALRSGLEYRHYFLDLRPEVGDPLVAGGALDQYAAVSLGLALRL